MPALMIYFVHRSPQKRATVILKIVLWNIGRFK